MIVLKQEFYNKKMKEISKIKLYYKIFKFINIIVFAVFITAIIYKYKTYIKVKNLLVQDSRGLIVLGMQNPILDSFNSKNQPYKIIAKNALTLSKNKTKFKDINALFYNKKEKTSLTSKQALFLHDKEIFEFQNKVFVKSKDNFSLRSQKTSFDVNKETLSGNNKIKFKNNIGTFTAQNFMFLLGQKTYIFNNNIKIKLKNNNSKISAEKAILRDDIKIITITENPIYTSQNTRITADKIIIHYQGEKEIEIKKIIANDNVKITEEGTLITGNNAIYLPARDIVEITGNTSLIKDNNIIKGEKLIYNLKDKTSKILKGKSNIQIK
jgi:lipopolysaccharide export system protein LptA